MLHREEAFLETAFTGNGEKFVQAKANDNDIYHTNSSGFHSKRKKISTIFIIHTFGVETGNLCMINIIVVGLTQTKLANLANTKVKREVIVAFLNFSPLPVLFPR